MVDYNARQWLPLLFRVRGSVMPKMVGRVGIATALGFAAAQMFLLYGFHLEPIAHTLIGVALGLLLVFRTNASYDRYWEGRKLLGAMVNRSRDVVRQVVTFLPGPAHAADRQRARDLIVAWYRLTAQGLRHENELAKVTTLTEADRETLVGSAARAQTVLGWLGAELRAQVTAGRVAPTEFMLIDANLTALMDQQGGCERIVRTPVPFAYAQHIKLFSTVFCFTAPFAMAKALGWFTPLSAALLCFALMGIDEIGVEIEDPFGHDPNDLPVDAIGDGIERVTQAMLDDARCPSDSRAALTAR